MSFSVCLSFFFSLVLVLSLSPPPPPLLLFVVCRVLLTSLRYSRLLQGFTRRVFVYCLCQTTAGTIAAPISQKRLRGVVCCQNSRHKTHSSPQWLQCTADVQLRDGFVVHPHAGDPATPIWDSRTDVLSKHALWKSQTVTLLVFWWCTLRGGPLMVYPLQGLFLEYYLRGYFRGVSICWGILVVHPLQTALCGLPFAVVFLWSTRLLRCFCLVPFAGVFLCCTVCLWVFFSFVCVHFLLRCFCGASDAEVFL